jgi:hypothetical protein
MIKPNHMASHFQKWDWIEKPEDDEKIKGGVHSFDSESCLAATIASLMNVMMVTLHEAK